MIVLLLTDEKAVSNSAKDFLSSFNNAIGTLFFPTISSKIFEC